MLELTIVGFSEASITMILDILDSNQIHPYIKIFNNLNLTPTKEYLHPKFDIQFCDKISGNLTIGAAKPRPRQKLFELIENHKKNTLINLISKNVDIASSSHCGKGLIINGMVCIAGHTTINDYAFINRGVTIGHHSNIGRFVTVNPGANIAGNVIIGEGSQIGIGANIIDGIKIGKNTIIGAGSLVTKNIPDNVVAYGNPCKIIRENEV